MMKNQLPKLAPILLFYLFATSLLGCIGDNQQDPEERTRREEAAQYVIKLLPQAQMEGCLFDSLCNNSPTERDKEQKKCFNKTKKWNSENLTAPKVEAILDKLMKTACTTKQIKASLNFLVCNYANGSSCSNANYVNEITPICRKREEEFENADPSHECWKQISEFISVN